MERNDFFTQLHSINKKSKGKGKICEFLEIDSAESKPFSLAIKPKEEYKDIVPGFFMCQGKN